MGAEIEGVENQRQEEQQHQPEHHIPQGSAHGLARGADAVRLIGIKQTLIEVEMLGGPQQGRARQDGDHPTDRRQQGGGAELGQKSKDLVEELVEGFRNGGEVQHIQCRHHRQHHHDPEDHRRQQSIEPDARRRQGTAGHPPQVSRESREKRRRKERTRRSSRPPIIQPTTRMARATIRWATRGTTSDGTPGSDSPGDAWRSKGSNMKRKGMTPSLKLSTATCGVNETETGMGGDVNTF